VPSAHDVATFLDTLLGVVGFPDYPSAWNGLQLDHKGPVHRTATAVDFSLRTIDAAIEGGANLLVLHHGMFWSGAPPLTGAAYRRLARLMAHDIAVYAAHLPLDAHERVGNCALLARALELEPTERFGTYGGASIGVAGTTDVLTHDLYARAGAFAHEWGGAARASEFSPSRRTRRWGVLTGAGADSETIALCATQGIDTLVVGEGPHHTTVNAPEFGCVVIYAGHYATETLGVRALATEITAQFGIPAEFLHLPTGS
jgi:dinuclear metal center YbgI/SA1388 family protein